MAQLFDSDGSMRVSDPGFEHEFAMQHHPTDDERQRRILVEQPPVSGGMPLQQPVRLWVLPEDLAANRDYFIVLDPQDAERKLEAWASQSSAARLALA
ncbi:MAG: hypothetical protein AAGC60_14085 [Acidobacteriota bacterium]